MLLRTQDFLLHPVVTLIDLDAQALAARLGYRPYRAAAAARAGVSFPAIDLVPVTALARDWNDADEKFFTENGIIATILGSRGTWASR